MEQGKLGVVESKFADIVWNNAPINSGELVKLCDKQLKWKKSTTYTVLKKMCDRGLFVNNEGVVEVIVEKDEYLALQSERIVDSDFNGSLPAFIAAFTSRKALSDAEIAEIKALIDSYNEEK